MTKANEEVRPIHVFCSEMALTLDLWRFSVLDLRLHGAHAATQELRPLVVIGEQGLPRGSLCAS